MANVNHDNLAASQIDATPEPSNSLSDWLKLIKCECLAAPLEEIGAETVEDLQLLDGEMISKLASCLKPIPKKKFLRALGYDPKCISPLSATLKEALIQTPVKDSKTGRFPGQDELLLGLKMWMQNVNEGLILMELAAEKGYPPAYIELHVAYQHRDNLNLVKSSFNAYQAALHREWLMKEAEKGNADVQYYYGGFLECVGNQPQQALEWFQKAAIGGNRNACNAIGHIYHQNGKYIEAMEWYRAGGDAIGIRNVAALYEKGVGVFQDFQEAAKLYKEALYVGLGLY